MKLFRMVVTTIILSLLVVSSVSAATVVSYLPKSNKLYSFKSSYFSSSGKKYGDQYEKIKYTSVGKGLVKGIVPQEEYLITHWYEDSKKGLYFVDGPFTAVWTKNDVLNMVKDNEAPLYLKYPVKKGSTWKGKYGTLVQGDYEVKNYSAQVVSTTEKIKTKYYNYQNVIKVKTNYSNYFVYRYFVKGIGMVKEETYFTNKSKKYYKAGQVTLISIK